MELQCSSSVHASWISTLATPASYNVTDTKKKKHRKRKQDTIFLSSPSLALCYHSFLGAFGSFKRNFTGTKWFYCGSLINREQQQLQTKRRRKKIKRFRVSASSQLLSGFLNSWSHSVLDVLLVPGS